MKKPMVNFNPIVPPSPEAERALLGTPLATPDAEAAPELALVPEASESEAPPEAAPEKPRRGKRAPRGPKRGHVQLVSGAERGKLTIYCPPEMRSQLMVLAAQRNMKVSDLAVELIQASLGKGRG